MSSLRGGIRAAARVAVLSAAGVLASGCQSLEFGEPDNVPARSITDEYPHLSPVPQRDAGAGSRPRSVAIPGEPATSIAGYHAPHPATDALGSPIPKPEQTIDLGVALRLAGVENPTINLTREMIREALARQLEARSLLLPDFNIGGNFYSHTGTLQTSSGSIRDVDRQSLYMGFGGRAVGSGTVTFPGIWLFAHLGDAVYEPLAARQQVAVRQSESQSVENSILLDVATAYLELVGAEQRLAVLRKSATELEEIVRITKVHAEKGQRLMSDAHRAATNADLLRRQIREAEENQAVASAQLCHLLNLDPAVRLRSPGGAVESFRLIPEDAALDELVASAVRSRPEVYTRAGAIQEALIRLRQERARPFVPVLSLGVSSGLFGGGSNQTTPEFGPLRGRADFDALAVWNLQNLGIGNAAEIRRADAGIAQAIAEYDRMVNQIRREVAEARANVQAASRQIEVARVALTVAEEGFVLESKRILDGFGRPIETLDSFRQLLDARQELIRTVIAFDTAQFCLFVAIGNNPLSHSTPNAQILGK